MQGFNGFPDGQLKTIALPALFFSELLPIIDDLAELRVTLYAFWALHKKEGAIRYLGRRDFTADDLLMESLGQPRRTAEAVLSTMPWNMLSPAGRCFTSRWRARLAQKISIS